MKFRMLFLRDIVYYRKSFIAMLIASGLVCAILTASLLIGDSVRGTLFDHLEKNTSFVRTLVRFPVPIRTTISDGVLHAEGYINPGIRTHIYSVSDRNSIQGRDVFCSHAIATKLQLQAGDILTINVRTIPAIMSEELLGRPPKLKQVQLIFRGVYDHKIADVNFENPQLLANNLFLNHDFLVNTLELEKDSVNEIWMEKNVDEIELPDEEIWKLSQLYFDQWNERIILKSHAYFLPVGLDQEFPEAARGITTFAESFSDGKSAINYCFVGAFDRDIFSVDYDHVIISDVISDSFSAPVSLTYFATDSYREIVRKNLRFSSVSKLSDSEITSSLNPEVPGLTDVTDCSHWDSSVPVDFDKITETDRKYWETFRSKPAIYLNFAQAQEMLGTKQCTVLIFDKNMDADLLKNRIVSVLRKNTNLYQLEDVFFTLRNNVQNGVHFAPLFFGLSLFIIVSALLILMMLIRLNLGDRSEEFRILREFTAVPGLLVWFHFFEIVGVLFMGIPLGIFLGVGICCVQLVLLEHAWNRIVLMNHLTFHANLSSFFIAIGLTVFCLILVAIWSLFFC